MQPYQPSEYRGVDGQLIRRLESAPPRTSWAGPPTTCSNSPHSSASCGVGSRNCPMSPSTGPPRSRASGRTRRARGRTCAWTAAPKRPVPGPLPDRLRRRRQRHPRKKLGITMDDLGFHEPWLVVDVLVNEDKLATLPQTQVQYCEPDAAEHLRHLRRQPPPLGDHPQPRRPVLGSVPRRGTVAVARALDHPGRRSHLAVRGLPLPWAGRQSNGVAAAFCWPGTPPT